MRLQQYAHVPGEALAELEQAAGALRVWIEAEAAWQPAEAARQPAPAAPKRRR